MTLNIIVSRNTDFQVDHEQCRVFASTDGRIVLFSGGAGSDAGRGETLYTQLLPQVTKLYLTEIEQAFEGDTFFPLFDRSQWRVSCVEAGETTPEGLAYCFVTWERRQGWADQAEPGQPRFRLSRLFIQMTGADLMHGTDCVTC